MDQYAQRITRDYPVRRKAQEKENMRTYLMGQLRALGYDAKQINQDESWQEESLENSKGSDAKDVNRARELRDEAVAKARAYAAAGDPVVFIGGLDHEHDLEGRDRTDMRLP